MPIGKDSIAKRVAKVSTTEENIAPELVATTAAAPKKAASTKNASVKKSSAERSSKQASEAKSSQTTVDTAVLSNVAPETVEKVIGHKEDDKYEKVSIGDDMPSFLL